MTTNTVRLTQLVSVGGCAAKLSAAILHEAMAGLLADSEADPAVLVGFDTWDDAGVYRLNETTALVQTLDFITPIVDDPFVYGGIAAANALSDVYAMGGRPVTALNVVCFPSTQDPGILRRILQGGAAKIAEAGASLLGGHSVDDPMIKYGVSVTGLVDPSHVLTNAGAQAGDLLILTKPLGVGLITTAMRSDLASADAAQAAIESASRLNAAARDAMVEIGVHACTDVTGFSLMGHLSHMARASKVTARVFARQVSLLPQALELARAGEGPGGLGRNKAFFGKYVTAAGDVESALIDVFYDPQTSGGLLIAVAQDHTEALLTALRAGGVVASAVIGEVLPAGETPILVA